MSEDGRRKIGKECTPGRRVERIGGGRSQVPINAPLLQILTP